MQGADSVIRRLVLAQGVSKPANPTTINGTKVRVVNNTSSPITIQPGGESTQLTLNRSNSYDCSTWATYYTLSYDYVGVFSQEPTVTTETKKFLVKQEDSE